MREAGGTGRRNLIFGSEGIDSSKTDSGGSDTGRTEKRTPHSIRFLDPEWERIEAFAEKRGLTGPEFVRFAALAAMEERPPSSKRHAHAPTAAPSATK